MQHYIKHLHDLTRQNNIAWEYLSAHRNLFGEYQDGDVSLCQLVAGDIYYKLTVNDYTLTDKGTAIFYIFSTHFYFPYIEEVRTLAIRRAKRIVT